MTSSGGELLPWPPSAVVEWQAPVARQVEAEEEANGLKPAAVRRSVSQAAASKASRQAVAIAVREGREGKRAKEQ